MKRAKPAATPPAHPVQPKEKSSPPSQGIASGDMPSDSRPAENQHASTLLPLGLTTTEPELPRETAANLATPPLKTTSGDSVEPSAVPSILLEGDEPKPGPETILPRRFAAPLEAEPASAPAESRHLPESYGTGRLLMTARDPNCLYAHWDLTSGQQQHHESLSAQKQLSLRVHEESVSGLVISEIQVPAQAHHSFVPVDAPQARRFIGELGYYTAEGSWRTVATADTAAAALAEPARSEPVRFATLSFGPQDPASDKITAPLQNVDSKALPAESEPTMTRSFPLPKRSTTVSIADQFSDSPEIVAPEESQNWPEVSSGFGDLAEEKSAAQTNAAQFSSSPGTQWTFAQERALAELIGWNVIRSESLGSAGIEELVRGIRRVKVSLPEALSSLGLIAGQPELFSAGLAGLPEAEQGFWFNVNAELVIYGATEPGATVTVGGRPIALRPDGTFSYRFALPDGSYHLPLQARSAHGEERAAALDFYRGTVYSQGTGAHPQEPGLNPPTVEHIT